MKSNSMLEIDGLDLTNPAPYGPAPTAYTFYRGWRQNIKMRYTYAEALDLKLNRLSHNQRVAVKSYRAAYEMRYFVAPLVGVISASGVLVVLILLMSIFSTEELSLTNGFFVGGVVGLPTALLAKFWFLSTIPQFEMPERPETYRGPIQGLDAEGWRKMQQKWDYKCAYCGMGLSMHTGKSPHREHVVPLSRGGQNKASNIVPACSTCNLSKHTQTGREYIASRRQAGLSVNPNWKWRA